MGSIVKLELYKIVAKLNDLDLELSKRVIMSGKVYVDEVQIIKPNLKFSDQANIRVVLPKKYVSRGAYKLEHGIKKFNIDPKNKVCLDIGSSTGGFTDVLLQNKAKKVYCVDVGTNQLDYSLRNNNKVVVMEQTNLKDLKPSMFNEKINLIVCDVSFISLKHVFKVCKDLIDESSDCIFLIKPQFEANSDEIEDGGFLPEEKHAGIIEKVNKFANLNNFNLVELTISPIKGQKSKNIEYIGHYRKVQNV